MHLYVNFVFEYERPNTSSYKLMISLNDEIYLCSRAWNIRSYLRFCRPYACTPLRQIKTFYFLRRFSKLAISLCFVISKLIDVYSLCGSRHRSRSCVFKVIAVCESERYLNIVLRDRAGNPFYSRRVERFFFKTKAMSIRNISHESSLSCL